MFLHLYSFAFYTGEEFILHLFTPLQLINHLLYPRNRRFKCAKV
jgi:hypothetical protein